MRDNYTGLIRNGRFRSLAGILILLLSSLVSMSSSIYPVSAPPSLLYFTGNTYYVANTGNDNNTGDSPDQAWKTISKVNQYGQNPGFQAGDRILFKGGETFDDAVLIIVNSGTEGDPVIFSSYGEGKAHLTKSGISHDEIIRILDQKYFTIENLEISNPDFDLSKTARGIRIEFTKPGEYPGVTIRNNHIHDIHGGMWTNRHLRGGIWMRSRRDVHAYTKDMLVENNHIERCHTRGMKLDAEGTAFHKNMVVRNNYVDNTGQAGIVIGKVDGGLIEGNTVYRAGNYYPEGDQAGVLAACWAAHSKNIIIQHNEVAYTQLGDVTRPDGNLNEMSHDSQAFDIDVTAPGWHLIQYNYTHDNEGGFFLWMGSPGPEFVWAVIRYNLSVNDGKGFDNRLFELHSHEDNNHYPVYVYNNTFVNDERIWINNRNPNSNNHKGWFFENNIFYASEGQYDDQESVLYKNNIYWPGTGPVIDSLARHADPRLLTPGTYGDGWEFIQNFRIGAGSLAIGRAVKESSRHLFDVGQHDLFGNSLSTNRAIGAHDRPLKSLDYLITDTIPLSSWDFDLEEPFDSISFYANDSLLGKTVVGPFALDWRNPAAGEYDMTAIAYFEGEIQMNPLSFTIHVYGYKEAEYPGEIIPGLMREYYKGSWYSIPDFSGLSISKKDTTSNIYLEPYGEEEDFALKFTTYLKILENGEYRFYLSSKDGSRLYIGNRLLIDNEAVHEVDEKKNSVLLKEGLHRLEVSMFNRQSPADLKLLYEGPGRPKQLIPNFLFFRPRGVPPVVSIIRPVDNALVNEGDTVFLKASVSDEDEDVFKIEFYKDNKILTSVPDTGYILKTDTLSGGVHTFYAKAYDLGGAVSVSQTVSLTINAAPVISFISPQDQSEFTRSETIPVEFDVEDENLQRAEVYVNNILSKTLTAEPFYYELRNKDIGSYFIRVLAIDSNNLTADEKIEFRVVNSIPGISIVEPADSSVFERGEEIIFKASLSDADDDVYKVAFYHQDVQVGSNANIMNETTVGNLTVGNYDIVAKAFDKAGATGASDTVHISVIHPVSVKEDTMNDFLIFPNPLKNGDLTICIDRLLHLSEDVKILISNIAGQVIYEQSVKKTENDISLPYEIFIDKGVYFITIQAKDAVRLTKLIVQ